MKLLFKTDDQGNWWEGRMAQISRIETNLELNWYPKKYKFGGKSGLDHLAFEVDGAKKFFERLSKKKYKTPIKPFLEGSWMLAYVKDPDGNWISWATS